MPSKPKTQRTLKCPRCESSMSVGFPIDRIDAKTRMQTWWVEGVPERTFITGGVKVGKRRVFAVETYRCDRCGFLESYATIPPDDPWWS